MNALEQFVLDLQPRILPLGLEIITQHPTESPDEPHRAYITERRGAYPVIWCATTDDPVPFGEVVRI